MEESVIAIRLKLMEESLASLVRWQADVIDDMIREEEYKANLERLVTEHTFTIRELEHRINRLEIGMERLGPIIGRAPDM